METTNKHLIRKQNLSEWVVNNGGIKAVCVKNGLNASVGMIIDRLLKGHRFDHRTARSIEAQLGIPHFKLDSESRQLEAQTMSISTPNNSLPFSRYLRNLMPEINSLHIKKFQSDNYEELHPQLPSGNSGLITDIYVSQEWLCKNIPSKSNIKNLYVLTGFGDEMRPLFNEGDPLLIDRSANDVSFNSIYFFKFENEYFIRRLKKVSNEEIHVISTNKKYDSWIIKPSMKLRILGRVVKAWSSSDF